MLYAVSEIVFFLLLATLLGIGVGWWMARSDRVSVVAAMDRSGAHAAANRELAEARGEIAQLSAKLAVATEAIRELEHEGTGTALTVEDTETRNESDPIEVFPEVPLPPVELRSDPAADGDDADDEDAGMSLEAPEVGADPESVAGDDDVAAGPVANTPGRSKDRGGKRLSARVAEASVFSRRDRGVPEITFDPED